MELKGKITISRPARGDDVEEVFISVVDSDASCEFLTIHLSLEDFARVLTGLGRVECVLETTPERLANVGTTHETKTEFVPGKYSDNANQAVAPFEVDGWMAVSGYFGNGHRSGERDGVHGPVVPRQQTELRTRFSCCGP